MDIANMLTKLSPVPLVVDIRPIVYIKLYLYGKIDSSDVSVILFIQILTFIIMA